MHHRKEINVGMERDKEEERKDRKKGVPGVNSKATHPHEVVALICTKLSTQRSAQIILSAQKPLVTLHLKD